MTDMLRIFLVFRNFPTIYSVSCNKVVPTFLRTWWDCYHCQVYLDELTAIIPNQDDLGPPSWWSWCFSGLYASIIVLCVVHLSLNVWGIKHLQWHVMLCHWPWHGDWWHRDGQDVCPVLLTGQKPRSRFLDWWMPVLLPYWRGSREIYNKFTPAMSCL